MWRRIKELEQAARQKAQESSQRKHTEEGRSPTPHHRRLSSACDDQAAVYQRGRSADKRSRNAALAKLGVLGSRQGSLQLQAQHVHRRAPQHSDSEGDNGAGAVGGADSELDASSRVSVSTLSQI